MFTLRLFDKRMKPVSQEPKHPLFYPTREIEEPLEGRFCRVTKTNEMAKINWHHDFMVGVVTIQSRRFQQLSVTDITLV